MAGAEWMNGNLVFAHKSGFSLQNDWLTWEKFTHAFQFSIPFLAFLTVHEFGHYFTAQWHKVKVTLPFYIPLWLGVTFTIGTMGAFIAIRSQLKSRLQFFDIGIAGPLAGFVVAVCILWYGYTHLPEPEYVFQIHPEYKTYFPEEYQKYGNDYAKYAYVRRLPDNEATRKDGVAGVEVMGEGIGKNLLMLFFENYIVSAKDRYKIPHSNELMHYPFLFAGFLGLLFTALNLLPIGQLDGGHILYGLIGFRRYNRVSPILFVAFVFYAGLGLIRPEESSEVLFYAIPVYIIFLYYIFYKMIENAQNTLLLSMSVFTAQFVAVFFLPWLDGYTGWLLFTFLIGRFLGVYHPPAVSEQPLNLGRRILGWATLLIFVLCFCPRPIAG